MLKRILIEEYLKKVPLIQLIDVRTPAEFKNGHIPGAVNIPLFSNEERAHVGTVYKQESEDRAYQLGFDIVRPKLDWFVSQANKAAGPEGVVVYCWRGGMRSRSFAEHISENGIENVMVIEGGYKAFRQHALNSFLMPEEILILGGYTGSGKTKILHELSKRGEQVIDLEGIAHHKGSAFGAIGQQEQPENEHFTNLLFWEWRELDTSRPVWLEDESIHIGKVFIPEVLFNRMREARVYFLDIPREDRARFLVEDYVGRDKRPLMEAITKISKRLGGVNTGNALEAISRDDYFEAALIALKYYDKYYLKGLNRRSWEKVKKVALSDCDHSNNAAVLLNLVYDNHND